MGSHVNFFRSASQNLQVTHVTLFSNQYNKSVLQPINDNLASLGHCKNYSKENKIYLFVKQKCPEKQQIQCKYK